MPLVHVDNVDLPVALALRSLGQTHVSNKTAVAVANKMARIIWAVWSRNVDYEPKAA